MIGRTFFRLTTHLRHRDELRVRLVLLGDVGQAAEDQHPHDDHQHQQPELFVTESGFLFIPRVGVYGLIEAGAAKGGQSYW